MTWHIILLKASDNYIQWGLWCAKKHFLHCSSITIIWPSNIFHPTVIRWSWSQSKCSVIFPSWFCAAVTHLLICFKAQWVVRSKMPQCTLMLYSGVMCIFVAHLVEWMNVAILLSPQDKTADCMFLNHWVTVTAACQGPKFLNVLTSAVFKLTHLSLCIACSHWIILGCDYRQYRCVRANLTWMSWHEYHL